MKFKKAVLIITLFSCLFGCGIDITDNDSVEIPKKIKKPIPTEQDFNQMRVDWNRIADGIIIPGSDYNFIWEKGGDFPEPTIKGGDYNAYETFGGLLADFLEDKENFNKLTEKGLLDYEFKTYLQFTSNWQKLAIMYKRSNTVLYSEKTRLRFIPIIKKIKETLEKYETLI